MFSSRCRFEWYIECTVYSIYSGVFFWEVYNDLHYTFSFPFLFCAVQSSHAVPTAVLSVSTSTTCRSNEENKRVRSDLTLVYSSWLQNHHLLGSP